MSSKTSMSAPGIPKMRARLLLRPQPDLARHRLHGLLEDMPDEPDGARHHAQSSHDLPLESELAADRADGPGGIQCQGSAERLLRFFGDPLDQPHVVSGKSAFFGDMEQPGCPRVDGLVDGMSEAGQMFAAGAISFDNRARLGPEILPRRLSGRKRFIEHPGNPLRAADEG